MAHCHYCHRELAEAEPLYRTRGHYNAHFRTMCGACAATDWAFLRLAVTGERQLAVSHTGPCAHCGRPIIFSDGYWPESLLRQRLSCDEACRKAIYATAARERRQRQRPAPRDCATCGEALPPRRADARYCSSACQQKAYRDRVKGAR